MTTVSGRLQALGLVIPPVPKPIGNYVPARRAGNLLFTSGVSPKRSDGSLAIGKVGAVISLDEGYEAARLCGLALLSNIAAEVESLDAVAAFIKVFGMVNAVPEFQEHPRVIDGCTDLLVAIFGEDGRPARSAIGVAACRGVSRPRSRRSPYSGSGGRARS